MIQDLLSNLQFGVSLPHVLTSVPMSTQLSLLNEWLWVITEAVHLTLTKIRKFSSTLRLEEQKF